MKIPKFASMEKEMDFALLKMFLPEGIFDYFELVGFDQGDSGQYVYDKTLTIHLEEKKIIPEEYKNHIYKASGFMEARSISDYPIRNMLVTLSVKRRRWDVDIDGQIKKISRDWEAIAQGTRMSKEYAAFLKEISRY